VTLRYDSEDPSLRDDPYAVYRKLRDSTPFCRGGVGEWVATRYADVSKLLSDPALGSQPSDEQRRFVYGDGSSSSFYERILLFRDPPVHSGLRRSLSQFLRGREASTQLDRALPALVANLCERVLEQGHCDGIAELANPLALGTVCNLLGLSDHQPAELQSIAAALAAAFSTRIERNDVTAADRAVDTLRAYVESVCCRVCPTDAPNAGIADYVSAGAVATDRLQRIDNIAFLIFAGFETSSAMIGNALALLAQDYSAFSATQSSNPSAVTAANELLRFDPPIQGVLRIVRNSIRLGDRNIRAGRVLILLIGSANRDPAQFYLPDKIDYSRRPNPHLSFGGGRHHCLGAEAARALLIELVTYFSRNVGELGLAAQPCRDLHSRMRCFSTLPLQLRA
jgi:cytochrome P450